MSKRILSVIVILTLSLSLIACGENAFVCGELSITLPGGYTERERPEGANMLISDGKSTLTFRRISLLDASELGIPAGLSAGDFAELFLEESGVTGVISSYNRTPYYTYYAKGASVNLFTLCAFYRTPYAYFILIFATGEERESEGREEYFSALDSVKIEIIE